MCSQVISHAGIYREQRWVRYFSLLLSSLFHDIVFLLVTSFLFRVKWTASKILASFCLHFQCWTPTMYNHSKIFLCVGYLNSRPMNHCFSNSNFLSSQWQCISNFFFFTSMIKYMKRNLKCWEICLGSWFKWLQLIDVGHQALEHLIKVVEMWWLMTVHINSNKKPVGQWEHCGFLLFCFNSIQTNNPLAWCLSHSC